MAERPNGKRLALRIALWGWVVLSFGAWAAQFRGLISALTEIG